MDGWPDFSRQKPKAKASDSKHHQMFGIGKFLLTLGIFHFLKTSMYNMKLDTWQIIVFLVFWSVESLAVPTVLSPFGSEQEMEQQLTTIDNRSEVTSIVFSPDGRLLAYGSKDNRVRLWDAESGRLLKTFERHTQPVTSVAFSADSLMLASGSEDQTIRLWDVASQTFLRTFEGHADVVKSLAFHPDGKLLASSANGGAIRLWNIHDSEQFGKPFQWQVQNINTVAFSPDGSLLATGSSDLKIRLWNTQSFKMYKPRMKCTKYQHVSSLDFSPNSKILASGFRHGLVCIWDTESKTLIKRLSQQVKRDSFNSVAFDAEGKRVAYSLYDAIYLWNRETDKSELLLTVPETNYISAVDFNPTMAKKNLMAYAYGDGTVRILNTDNKQLVGILADNAEGKWFSCMEEQPCWCSGQSCTPSVKEPVVPSDENPSTAQKADQPDESELVAEEAEADNEPPSSSDKTDWVTGGASRGDDKPSLSDIPPARDSNNIIYVFLLMIIALIIIGIVVALLYRRFICKHHASLLTTPLPLLPEQYQLLKRTFCLTQALATNQVSAKQLEKALAFVQNSSPAAQAELLAKRLGAIQCEASAADLFTVYLHQSFVLNLPKLLYYFPSAEQTGAEILNQLQQREEMALQKVVIITLNPEQLETLRPYGEDTSNLWVVPDSVELTQWLLSPEPVSAFTRLITEQLQVTQISPYQTHSGVNKDVVFFGRTHILDRILNNDLTNYLIVGGRQLGKSSLLKYIYRRYQNHLPVHCHYLTLHGNSLPGQLAVILGMPSDSDLESVLKRLIERVPGQQQLFLFDQADQFIQAEMKSGYPTLNRFRSLSEEGYCYFIFTGIWDLYYASVLDSQSPLKNFGETIRIGALEADACRDLAVKPMQAMHLRYETEELVDQLLRATGQRANLIAIVGHEMLKGVKSQHRVFGEEDLASALKSEAVREALKGWGMLSVNEPENRLDRIVVYATIRKDEFKLEELMSLLETYHCTYTAEQLKHSLERLALNFVIQREAKGGYKYSVPLFRDILLEDNVDELLRWELEEI